MTAPESNCARVYRDSLAQAVAELVRTPSVNPLQSGPIAERHGPIGENALAQMLARKCTSLGADDVVLDEVLPGRPNMYARFPGRSERTVVVDVHIDTVTVENMDDPPFDGRIEDGFVWGRGALDSKASLGVLLALLEAWHNAGVRPQPTLLLVATVSEEAGGLLGATRFARWAREQEIGIDQILVAEPTEFRPIHGLKGLVLVEVLVHGVAAHSSRPDLGVNAIEAAARVITAFVEENHRLRASASATELGNGTLSVTQASGGNGSNVIPDSCSLTVGRRLVPGEDPAEVIRQLTEIASAAAIHPCTVTSLLPLSPEGKPGTLAFYQRPDSDLVRFLAEACATEPAVAPFGTNALRYEGLARESVVFGPGSIDDAHQATERIALTDLELLADVYEKWLSPA